MPLLNSMTTIPKVGFACKWIDHSHQVNGISPKDDCKKYNTGTTTVAWLSRQTRAAAEDRLWTLLKGNIESVRLLVARVAALPPPLRMVRLSSDILPVYTHADWSYFYRQSDVRAYMELHFAAIGECARAHSVRLSFHPGQFCCIVSENEGIVENSLEELEYHADMMRMMGYGNSLLDAKINIHLSGKRSVSGFVYAWNRMSTEMRNMLTLENDEFSSGLDTVLELKDKVGIVLDLHHHWINTGEYINADDERIKKIIESWCRDGTDRRPVIHYSQSREDVLTNHDLMTQPSMTSLLESGIKKAKLRAHSDSMWNQATNKWAKSHWEWADAMIECKSKNLASENLLRQWKSFDI